MNTNTTNTSFCAYSLDKTIAPTPRVVEHISRAYVFGHYDSRGGASLIVAKFFSEALVRYAEGFGYNEDLEDPGMKEHMQKYGHGRPGMLHMTNEWYPCRIRCCGECHGNGWCDIFIIVYDGYYASVCNGCFLSLVESNVEFKIITREEYELSQLLSE